jgi:sortase A
MRRAHGFTWLGGALVLGGAILLGFYGWRQHASDRAQRDAREWLDRTVKARQTAPRAPNPPHPHFHHGDVVGRLTIPRLDLSVMVFEGDDAAILKKGAGHIRTTSFPNQNGNLGIAAHRDTYFRPLRLIHPNDVIEFTTAEGVSRYTVTDTEVVWPSDVQVLAKVPGRDLTLVTCYPFYYLGSAPKRWIVHAKRVA